MWDTALLDSRPLILDHSLKILLVFLIISINKIKFNSELALHFIIFDSILYDIKDGELVESPISFNHSFEIR